MVQPARPHANEGDVELFTSLSLHNIYLMQLNSSGLLAALRILLSSSQGPAILQLLRPWSFWQSLGSYFLKYNLEKPVFPNLRKRLLDLRLKLQQYLQDAARAVFKTHQAPQLCILYPLLSFFKDTELEPSLFIPPMKCSLLYPKNHL